MQAPTQEVDLAEQSRELQALFFGGEETVLPAPEAFEPVAKAAAKSPPRQTDQADLLLSLIGSTGQPAMQGQARPPEEPPSRVQGMSETQREAAREDLLLSLASQLGQTPPSEEEEVDRASPAQDLLAIFQSQMQMDGDGRRLGEMKLSNAAMQRMSEDQSRKAALPQRDPTALLSLFNQPAKPPQATSLLSLLNARQAPTFPPEFENGSRLQEFQRLMVQGAPP